MCCLNGQSALGGHGRLKACALGFVMLCVFSVGIVTHLSTIEPRNNNPEVQPLVAAFGDSDYPNQLKRYALSKEKFYYAQGRSADTTFLLGDSHMEQYSPRIVDLMKRNELKANTAMFATDGGCLPIPGVFEDAPIHKRCEQLRVEAGRFLKQRNVKVVVIGGCWNCYFIERTLHPKKSPDDYEYYFLKDGVKEYFRNGNGSRLALAELERFLREIGKDKEVYLLLDNPSGDNFYPHSLVGGSRLTTLHERTCPRPREWTQRNENFVKN